MSAPSSGDSRRVVLAALAGNVLIALAKLVAAALSGSAAMLAEGVHSLADTANQGLLLLGMGLSVKENHERFPFGRAAERYFWAFIVALMLFSLGGAFAIYEGIHRLLGPAKEPESIVVSVVVLVVSLVIEGGSFMVAVREFNRSRRGRSVLRTLLEGRDPTIPVVLLEDTGAVIGLLIALVAVFVSAATKSSVADAVGSLVIGVLLCGVGLVLAFQTHGLLIGESATPEMRTRAHDAVLGTPGVQAVTQMLTLHLGPDTVVLALKVRFPRASTVEEVERVTDAIEDRVRSAVPEMKKIFVEADGHYDAALDPGDVEARSESMKIYTKTGDSGTTGLFGGARVDKDDERVEAYGTVDEVNAVVGTARAAGPPADVDGMLERIQADLFVVGAELATVPGKETKLPMQLVAAEDAERLERAIDALELGLPPLTSFILPGGTAAAAALHHARTVCRRAERRVLRAGRSNAVRAEVLVYLNRLSDYLFVAARRSNHAASVADVPWAPRNG